jgi:type 1 glutamine amidotransferase
MKKVLLVTDGIFHPPYFGRMVLHKALAELKGFEFQYIRSMEKIPRNLKDFSALVLYVHHKNISDAALGRLDDFVSSGSGILAIHSATASFKETKHFFKILGGRFLGHGAVENFEVKRVKDEIFDGIGDFVIKDELYLHELQPGIEVHFTTKHEDKDVPVVWTYRYGKGRVCYTVPGHTTASMKHPAVQKILRRGLAWVCNL